MEYKKGLQPFDAFPGRGMQLDFLGTSESAFALAKSDSPL